MRGIIIVLSIGIVQHECMAPEAWPRQQRARSCCHAWRWREPREDRPASTSIAWHEVACGIFRHIPTRLMARRDGEAPVYFLYEKDAYTVRVRSWRHNKGRRARGDVAAAAVLGYWITYLYKFVLLRDCLVGIRTPLRCACRDVDRPDRSDSRRRRRRRPRRPPCRLQ